MTSPSLGSTVAATSSQDGSSKSSPAVFNATESDMPPECIITVGTRQFISCEDVALCEAALGHWRLKCYSGLKARENASDVVISLPKIFACDEVGLCMTYLNACCLSVAQSFR